MKKILVPTDFSQNAMKAAMYASEIAERNGAQVHFLHSVALGNERPPGPRGTVYDRYARLVMEDAKDDLKTFRHAVKRVYKNVSYRTVLAANDSVVKAIAKYALKHEFDLVIMGTKGRKGVAAVFGSVTSSVISKVPLPVLAIPVTTEPEKPGDILLATDQFEQDHHLLQHVVEIVKLFGSRLHVVSVVSKDGEAAGSSETAGKLAAYADYLKAACPGAEIITKVLEGEHVEFALERYCITHHIGMIAVIPHKKSILRQITGGSVSRKLVLHAETPVLNLRDGES